MFRASLPLILAAAALGVPSSIRAQPQAAGAASSAKPADDAKDGACCIPPLPPPLAKPPADDRKSRALFDVAVRLRSSTAAFLGGAQVSDLQRRAATLRPDTPPGTLYMLRRALGDSYLRYGELEHALEQLEQARALAARSNESAAAHATRRLMALCWMRIGERQNCLGRHNEDSCLFPLQGAALHVDKEGSTRAVEILTELLREDGGDLESIWLLNVAQMTLGKWPDGVPRQWRITPESLASEHPMPRMHDVSPRLGFRDFSRSGASIVDDFDGDGRMEVLTTTIDPETPMSFYRRQPDGTFKDVAGEIGLAGQLGGLQAIHFDANNDGRLDFLVMRGAWAGPAGEIPNSLLIQQADGSFVDRTLEAGIEVAAPSQVAAVADMDNDGDLDLFCGYESEAGPSGMRYPSRLYRNRGDATFEDVTDKAGVANERMCKGAAFADYDGDRLPDLYVSNMHSANRLYRNDGDGTFTDVALELGVHDPFDSFPCWFFDYDNDGRLDLFVGCFNSVNRTVEIAGYYKNHASGTDTMRLYENDGRGGFRDVTRARGLSRVAFPMGSSFGDVDNDGWLDLYLATGDPEFGSLWPNVMYRNDRGRAFQDVTTATDTGHLQKGHGVSFADLDGDGDQDLFVKMGGAYKDDRAPDLVFENPGHGNRWLTVRLVGRRSNRFGVGARVRVRLEETTGARDVYAFVGMNSSFGGNSLQEEIGLGRATRIVELEVYWPTSDLTQTFRDVPLDRIVLVEEGERELRFPLVVLCPPPPP